MTAEPVISFKDVSKSFRRPDGRGDFVAVDKLSFEIAKGEIVAVLGKTGCGKSTMFNIVAGLIEPSAAKRASSATIRFANSISSAARSASCSRTTG